MNLFLRLAAAGAACIAAVWLISQAPGIQLLPERQQDVQAFRPEAPVLIDETNVVDWLLAAPVPLEIEHVDWSHRILSIDFRAELPVSDPEALYGRLLEFVHHAMVTTRNVERVWLRLVESSRETGGGPDRLLMALDVKRERFSAADYERWKQGTVTAEAWMREKFEWSMTPQWRNATGL